TNGRVEALVIRLQEIYFRHQQQARIKLVATKTFGKGTELLAPCLLVDRTMDLICARPPVARPLHKAEMRGDICQPVTCSPAHEARRCMDTGAGAEFPHACIRLVMQRKGTLAHRFITLEIHHGRALKQPLIEKGLRSCEDHISINIVLEMLISLVAAAHWPHAAIPR